MFDNETFNKRTRENTLIQWHHKLMTTTTTASKQASSKTIQFRPYTKIPHCMVRVLEWNSMYDGWLSFSVKHQNMIIKYLFIYYYFVGTIQQHKLSSGFSWRHTHKKKCQTFLLENGKKLTKSKSWCCCFPSK